MEPKFVLAPMDGMTRAFFRSICFEYGADGATTEMIQSLAFGRAKRKMSPAFMETLIRLPNEKNLAAQLIGSDPKTMGESAKRLTALGRFDAIEINMGCPARKVVGSGNGCALMNDIPLAVEVMKSVKVNTHLPVRLKMRLGWDRDRITAPYLAFEAERLGFESLTIHGRTREQMYRDRVDSDAIRGIAGNAGIPVFANGGVTCALDALQFLEKTGAAGVSIGRAALKQPWIFEDIHILRSGGTVRERGARERIELLIRMAALSCMNRPEQIAVAEMRKFADWLLTGLSGSEQMLKTIKQTDTLDEYRKILDRWLASLEKAGDTEYHGGAANAVNLDTRTCEKKKDLR